MDFDYIANLGGADPSVVFRHEDGTISNELTSSTELARFTYELGAGFSSSSGWSIGLTRQLKKIELLSQQGAGQYILVSNQEDVKLNDLSALITGNGNITFGFSAEEQGQEGWITLNNFDELDESKTNDYYGVTRVGYNDQGVASDTVHLVFGKTEALGNTSLLNVQTNSEVLVGGKDGDKAYSQNVGALSGAGTIALGSSATLNLNQFTQTGDITEPVGDEPGKINIANQFTGGNGATVNISLTGDLNNNGVSGYEVVFEPGKTQQELFTGLISLAGGSVSAYKDVGINEILLDSTLKLNNEGWVRVDSTGQINNLIISSGAGGIEFSSLGNVTEDGKGALTVNGDLTFDGADATVSIKDFDYDLGQAADSMDLIDADDGLLNTLVRVKGDVIGEENYGFVLDEASRQDPVDSAITDENNHTVASGTWVLEDKLHYDGSGNFDLAYTLTQVDIIDGETLTISGSDTAPDTQDFTAKITGSGNIVFDAAGNPTDSGSRIEIGDSSTTDKNDYTGSTTVTDGTTLVLTESDAMGQTSDLIAYGDIEIGSGIEQTVKNINSDGTGKITIADGDDGPGVLNVNADASQTINNIIAGNGSFNVDLSGSGNSLVFNNENQGSSFTGNMTLSNGRFSMSDGSNASFAANAGIVLGSGSTFDLGSGSQNIKDLTVNADSKLESSALVIGSQTPAHTISGSLTLNANTSLTLNDISVADDLSLVDYDGSTHAQQFISAGRVTLPTGSITVSGGENYLDLSGITLNYSQGSGVVAETVWSISDSLTQSGSGFDVNVELSEIKLIDNTVISGSGTNNELSALISNSTQDGSHSLQFSLADGATSADFLVNHANGNTYSGSTTVDSGVSVTLGVNSGFGNTSNLIVKEGGTVKLNDGFSQVVGGLSGTGTVNLAGTGSVLTLTQNESAAISNLLSGNGTFEVNLGGSGNQLSFTNSGSSGFVGTVDLSSGFLVLEGATTTQSVMDGASLVLGNSGVLKVEGTASYQAQIGSLSLDNGSRLELGAVDFGEAADRSQLIMSNDMTISGSVTLSVGGINLDGTTDILTASSTGLRQALITANGGITNNGTLAIVAADLDASEIRNSGSSDVAAYGVWTPQGNNDGVVIDEKTIYASLKLNEIQLALDNGEGLLLDLSGQSSASLDAKLTNYDETSGDITFSGAGNLTLTNSGNEFTGGVYVESNANVTLGVDYVLGSSGKHTSLLDITGEGSQVNLNGTKQYVGSINATVDGALTGSGSLTIDGANQQSTITGSNTGLSADITLSSGHTLAINNVASIGTSGILTVADNTKLQISGASEGTFTKQLTGGGDIFVDASTFTVSGANSGFTGTWHIAENAQTAGVTVSGTTSQIDASIGSGATVALGSSGEMSLVFSETNATLTIDDVFTGAGQLTVSGTTGAEGFGFATEWNQQPGFSGTLALNHIGMQVGGADGSVDANNASNLSNADLILNNSTVTVNGNVDTFDRVTVAAGSSGTFTLGGLGFSAPDSTIAGISQLSVGSLDLNAGQTLRIQVSAPAANGDLLGSVAQTNLISGGMSPFQTLISTDKGITINGGTVELVDAAGNAVADDIRFSQQINNAEGTTVASGYYSIEPGLTNNDLALGIGYTLEQIDILSTLTLSEEGTVEAQITSNSTSGNLTIASSGNITLTNSGNEFSGDTTIASGGRLVAHEKALGKTDDLVVSGTYVNSGANAVNRVEVDGSGQLTLNADLTLKNSGATSEIFGVITGNGDLLVNQGTLSVNENVGSSGYAGVVELGETNGTNGTLVLNGAEGLGSGSIVFNTAGSTVKINDSNDVLFSNEMSGQGIISVNLSGNETNGYDFAFGSTQNGLENGSSLILDKANFDLTASDVNVNDDVAQKLIITVNQGSTLSNDGTANKTIAGLKLYGGTVDMGVLESGTGQISLNNGTLTIDQGTTNTIVLDSQAQTSESGDRTISSGGQELLAGGLFDLTIFENVASVSGSDGSNVLGTSDADGNQSVSGLVTNSGFSGTSENLFQDADDDGTEDFVATMTRDSGSFFYNANSGNVFLQYSFKEINLLWTDLEQGLTIDATGRENAALSAHVTGGGNLRLGGTLTISGSSSDNDYIGRTYVLKGASVTVAQDSGFGVTKELNIADGAVVTMSNNVSQTVASLTGTSSGTLTLGDNAAFTIDNGLYADSKLSSIDIGTTISGGSGATFAIDGDGVAVNFFAKQSNLSGATFKLLDAQFAIADSKSLNYLTSASSNDFVLGSGADVMVTAGDTPYKYNELTFAGGELSVNGVMLASGSTGAIIHTEFLDLSQNSTLSVSADIDENFDILVNDSDSYSSTLIAFDDLSEKGQLATPISGYATSSIDRNNDDVAEAYVGWSGQVVWSFEDELNRSGSGSVGIEYQVQNLQLALDSGAGLVVSTTHSGAATEQSTLTATITDYQDTAGHITFSGGDITIGGTGTNDYRGETFIDSGKVTLAKNSGFGQTEKLTIEGGGVDIAGFSQTLGALSVDSDASISGSGSLTLGSAAYSGTSSTVSGVLSNLTGTVSLTNGHTLTMNQAEGLGASGTFSLETGTTVYVKGDQNTTDTRGNFSKAVTGDGTVVFDNSTNINITGSNSGYTGDWTLQNNSTAFVNGNGTLTADAMLGSGGMVTLSSTGDVLQISQNGGEIVLDNVFAGNGRLEVIGTADATGSNQTFSFYSGWSTTDNVDFTGTLAMSGSLDMTVGGAENSSGAYNASNLANADVEVGSGSVLVVESGGTVSTFKDLTFNGGSIEFGSTMEVLPGTSFGNLTISGALTVADGDVADISIDWAAGAAGEDRTGDTLANTSVVSAATNNSFVTLINGASGTVDLNDWTLNTETNAQLAGNEVVQGIVQGTSGAVADAVYGYQLSSSTDGTDLGILFDMKGVRIYDNATLNLTETGTLDVVISDKTEGSGGGLLVRNDRTDGGLILTGTNSYTGATTVESGSLTAEARGLGATSALIVEEGATYTNAGLNTVGSLDVDGNLDLNSATTLEITSGTNAITDAATVSGNGVLNLNGGSLTVTAEATSTSGYMGAVGLAAGTDLNLTGTGEAVGLGTGVINTAAGADVLVSGAGNRTLTNTIAGAGTLTVNLGASGNLFRFNAVQSDSGFTGTLNLTSGTVDLTADSVLQSATLATNPNAVVIINDSDSTADRHVGNLHLAGGRLDFGAIDTTNAGKGQIVVSGDVELDANTQTTVDFALSALDDANGEAAFGTGQKIYIIKGYQHLTGTAADHFVFDGTDQTNFRQTVQQHDDDVPVAELVYNSGAFGADASGIFAKWDLSQINLLSKESGGYVISTSGSDAITATITGSGDVTYADGNITIASNGTNDYWGRTFVTGAALNLAKDEALGNTSLLDITSGSVAVNATKQTIGSLQTSVAGAITMATGGRLELSGDSTVSGANIGIASGSTIALADGNETLTINDIESLGRADISLGDGTTLLLNGIVSGSEAAVFDNAVSGASGTVALDGGAHVEFTSMDNDFGTLHVYGTGTTAIVNNMQGDDTALGNAHVDVDSGSRVELAGTSSWTLDNALDIAAGGTLAVTAGGSSNIFSFGNTTNQNVIGNVSLTNALLYIGGAVNGGSGNAAVLKTATLEAGSGAAIHVATGDSAQQLAGLDISGGDVYFEGTLGLNADTTGLGQLTVGQLTIGSGTIHATASDTSAGAGSIESNDVISAQEKGSYQNLIRVSGDQTLDGDALNGLRLFVVDNAGEEVEGIVSKIMSGNDEVAEGTYDYVLAVGEDRKSLGVAYKLTEINLLTTLDVIEFGTMTARLTGSGNLTVSGVLELDERTETNGYNDYTGETTVVSTGELTAEANTLGHGEAYTSKLTVDKDGAFTNAGNNVIGSLEANGDLELNATLTIKGGDSNRISDDVSGSGDVILESGKLTAQNSVKASGYEGDIVLGVTNGSGAELELNGLSGFGSGQIQLANAESDLRLTNLSAGTATLTNTVSGAGDIYANSTAEEAVFGFNSGQTAAMLSGASVQLSGVDYDLSAEGSDVLDDASLSLTDGTLYVNRTGVQSNRTIAGLTLDGAKVDFGEMGTEGGGVIDLEKHSLNVSESGAVFTFESDLSTVQSDNGAAALTTGETITLVTNAAGSNVDNITVNADGGSGYSQAIEQGKSGITAYLTGTIASGLTASDADNDGDYDLSATLTHQNLEIVSNFVVSSGGELSLKVTDHDYDSQTGSGAGSLTISGAELTLSNSDNDYHGATNIEAGGALTLANDRVLGNTSLLNVDGDSRVSFGETNQTIGELQSSGVLTSATGENAGTLTITNGGRASGDNDNFHMDVELSGTQVLTLTSAGALGDGDVTIVDAYSQLVLEAIGSGTETATVYGNSVHGKGGISITSGANVALTGENDFGSLTVDVDSTVSAEGDVYSHIGKGTLNLDGTADFTVTDTLTGDWIWNKKVSGTGMLVLGRTESPNVERKLLLDAGAIKEYEGALWLENWNITLDEAQSGGTFAALSGSKLAQLVIGTGASADIMGNVNLSNKTVSVASGTLSFSGVDAPGGSNDEAAHLTVDRLELGSDFVIDLGVTDPDVEAGSLLTQDTASGTTVTVATGLNGIDVTPEDGHVTVNGSEVADDDTIRFNVQQTSTEEANVKVAEGIYGVDIKKTSGDGGAENLVVEYTLQGVDIDDGRTLEMRGTSSDQNDDANTFGAYLTGAGNLEIAAESVRLTATNSYTGTTTVASGATLYVDENSLGTDAASTASLNIAESGAVHVNGNNVVRGIQNNGGLYLGSQYPTGDAGEADAPTLTLQSDVSAGSRIDGTLYGVGTLKVVGSGDVDNENHPADLTIVGSQGDFLGDLVLDSGAWVHLDATSSNLFGSSSSEASNEIQVSEDSLLTIASDVNRDSAFSGVLKDGSDGKGGLKGGRVVMTLASTDNEFAFSSKQSEDDFTGTFALERGTINLGNLTDGGELGNRVLAKATLELGAESVAELERSTAFSAVDSFLGGLTMNGGTIAFGSINYDGGDDPNVAGAHASHINLGGDGVLTLVEQGEGQKQSTITISQDETNRISDAGDELLAADDGTSIVLIHNIGSLHYIDAEGNDFGDVTDKALSGGYILSEHLHLDNEATEQQLLEQNVTKNGETSYQEVAEVVRTFDKNLTFGESNISDEDGKYAVSLGYTVDRVGLLFMTDSVSTPDFDYKDEDMWQGLTITTSTNKDLNNYEALITNGGSGTVAGNLVLRGNAGNELTISNENTYTGKTWLKDGAKIVFGADAAFGTTEALRVDSGSSFNLGDWDQKVGALYTFDENAILGGEDAVLTVTGPAVINGANSGFAGTIKLGSTTDINDAGSLGTGTAQLSGSTVNISGASGAMTNTFTGDSNSTINVANGSTVGLSSEQIAGYRGEFSVADTSTLDLTLAGGEETDAVFGNLVTVKDYAKLSVSTDNGGGFVFGNLASAIEGTLEIENAKFEIPVPVAQGDTRVSVLKGADLVLGSGAEVFVSHAVGTDQITNLTLNNGSTLTFEGGATPGVTGDDSQKGHINLESGTVKVNGDVTVRVDVGDYVNADMVGDAQESVTNLPLTATDIVGDTSDRILANLVSGTYVEGSEEDRLTLDVIKGENVDYVDGELRVGIYNNAGDTDVVATGTYDYTLSTNSGGINLAYGLTAVDIHELKTLELKGYEGVDNELAVSVSGKGGLAVTDGTIRLTGKNAYEGETTIGAGAELITSSNGSSLGNTSMLRVSSSGEGDNITGSTAKIRGTETVGALMVNAGSTLMLGHQAGGTSSEQAVFTIDSTRTNSYSVIAGALEGGDDVKLVVKGDGDSTNADLTVQTANEGFLGDIELDSAHVKLESLYSLGVNGTVVFDEDSTLEISSSSADATTDDNHYGDGEKHNVHIFKNTLVGDGTLRVSLDNADDYFDFDESQYHYPSGEEQQFTGTLELESGIFKFTEDNADVLESVHVVLNESGTLDISANATNTVDRTMRGLTLEGGTLEFGSLSIDRVNSESMSAHIDLMGNNLTLVDSEHKASISFDQNAANNLSSSGSEVVNASDSDGSKIVLIHDIGDLKIRDASGAEHNIGSADNLNDYFELDLADTSTAQTLKQALTTAGPDGELTDVAVVHRNFGAFGYENLADVNLGNAVYVGYKIDSIELIHSAPTTATGDTLWEGLTVSTSEASHELRAQITGHGNLVIANGTGGTLVMGVDDDNSANDNSYTGRTWVQAGASVAFAADNAFGSTSALRIDAGANVDLGAFEQTVGNLYANSDNALSGGDDSLLVVTGNAEISGTNENFTGTIVFNSNDALTGFVTEVDGLGDKVVIGEKYTLEVTDQDPNSESGTIDLSSDLVDYEPGHGGVLAIGSIDTSVTGSTPIELTGQNSGFSGTIRVHDGWSLDATVNEGESIEDRLGTGMLHLVTNGSAAIDFNGQAVHWNHEVSGGGNLMISADANQSVDFEDGLDNFSGAVTIGGGSLDLAGNKENLGNASGIAAEGEDTKFHVSSDGSLEFGKNVVVSDGASLVFDDAINFSEQADPELEIDGTLSLNDATVKVTMEGDVEIGDQPDGSLDMGAITLADEGEIEYVIAEADRIERGNYKLEIAGPSGALTTDVAITDNGRTVATGTYDFGLSVARGEEKDSLGLSYQLTAVDIHGGETLRLAGADDNTALADRDNASVFSADIKGAGNLSLVTGELTLTGDNTYYGETTIGADGAQAVLTVGEGSSLGTTSAVTVNASSALVNESTKTTASRITVAEGGALNLDAWREQSGLRKVSRLELTNGASVINGTFFGEGELVLSNDASVDINNMADYEYTGRVTVGEDARYALHAEEGTTFEVRNDFSAKHDNNGNQIENAGTVAFDGNGATFNLQGSASGFTNGTFSLGDDVTLTASNIDAIGGEGSTMLITTADENDSAVFRFAYDEMETDLYLALTQTMTKGITFEKTGDGVVELSDNAMGAGEVDVKAGGILFGTAKTTDAYNTALTVESGGWAAGFGGVSGLTVQREGSFYVGGRSGYNSILNGVSTLAEGDEESGTNTVKFTVKGGVSNSGVIYVGNKTTEGAAPADEGAIGNELVIEGDYNVTASDNGGILDMNAVIAGNDDSKADHVTITGKINGNGYVDVNYDSTVSTGGTLEYLGLVKVEGGDDGDSLRLKDTIKIGDLWYRLMWSSDQNEYYLQSSVTDPGDKPWDTEDVENVNAGTRSALAFMQAQAFDLSLRGHLGETLYVDPVTGEQRKSSFWMVQRGDWTKFSNASGQMDADGNLYTTHLGTDLFKRETDGATFRWGVLAGFADGDFDVSSNVDGKTSKGSFRGYSAGLYMTAESKAESGPFLGLQLRWNRFDSEVGQDDYDVNGLSLTAEASWDQLLSKGITDGGRNYEWRLEPHVRAYWTNFGDPDDWTSSLGETYSSDFDNGLLVRVGARTKIQTTLGTGPAWQAYAEANWVYNNGDYSTTMSTKYGDVTSTQNGAEFAEFRLGLEAQFTTNVNVWLEGHHQTGSDDYESTGAMFGFKYMW